jgi:hypothetical protein
VIYQSNDGSDAPFSVNLFDTTVRFVRGGVAVSSNGGTTVIQGSTFENLDMMAIGSVGNGGIMIINDAQIAGGTYEVR